MSAVFLFTRGGKMNDNKLEKKIDIEIKSKRVCSKAIDKKIQTQGQKEKERNRWASSN
jgi:hypothetical protein